MFVENQWCLDLLVASLFVLGSPEGCLLYTSYNSFVSEKIEDFNSSFYYDAPQNILNTYLTGIIE